MSLSELQELTDDLSVSTKADMVRIRFGEIETNWMSSNDAFMQRISVENLNRFYPLRHLQKEIQIRNVLDEGIGFLSRKKYAKAIECFDSVIWYDDKYSGALISKSHALYAQGHFVKALRFYRKSSVSDNDYYRMLLKESAGERDNFPRIKRNIYAGDEASSRGEYEKALDFYEKALVNPSKFKNRILFKLLNKKAFVLCELSRFDEALASFDASLGVRKNDTAYFGRGYCQYVLGMDCIESLDMAHKIDKKPLLLKASIFNEMNEHEKALECFCEFLDNHFVLDDDFTRAVEGKAFALEALSKDSSCERDILSQLDPAS